MTRTAKLILAVFVLGLIGLGYWSAKHAESNRPEPEPQEELNQDAGVHKLGYYNPGRPTEVVGGYGFDDAGAGGGGVALGAHPLFVDAQGNEGTNYFGPSITVAVTAATGAITQLVDGGGKWRIWCVPASGVIGAWVGVGSISAAASPAVPISINPEIWDMGVNQFPVLGLFSTPGSTCYLNPTWAPQQ